MGQKLDMKIGEILIEVGLLSKAQLGEALAIQKEKGGMIGEIFVRKQFIDEESLVGALGKQFKVPYIPLKNYAINPDMADVLTADFCHAHTTVAFDCDQKKVYIAIANPASGTVIEEIRTLTGRTPQVFLGKVSEILNAIYFIYHEEP
jgi:type IV pilus assembly protein PilB